MIMTHENVVSLLEYVHVDRFYISCYFRCQVKNKTILSVLPFEPYDGKIVISLKQKLLHPIQSYNRYHHTPITIYANDCHETIVLKAFKKISNNFTWNQEHNKYICNLG